MVSRGHDCLVHAFGLRDQNQRNCYLDRVKGIVLAGGTGSRLWPLTLATSKQLLPVYDKPLIFYPLSVLMLADVREILIIGLPDDLPRFQRLLGDGSSLGLSLQYAAQDKPRGIAEALLIGEEFAINEITWLVLGDNIFFGNQLRPHLMNAPDAERASIFAYRVANPSEYAVVSLSDAGEVERLVEKPSSPESNLAVPGLYCYPPDVGRIARKLSPSARGELEITDLNNRLLEENLLHVEVLPRGTVWLDAGTFDSLMEAGNFVQTVEKRQGFKIACLEEIALGNGWIEPDVVEERAAQYGNNSYGDYLRKLL